MSVVTPQSDGDVPGQIRHEVKPFSLVLPASLPLRSEREHRYLPPGCSYHIPAMLVCEAITFQPSSNFSTFIVLFPTTGCLELGKETDHTK
jgi:hypothetical protein